MDRSLDVILSFAGILVFGPIVAIFAAIIWLQDRASPFYLAPRAGLDGREFTMVKLRSMIVNADRAGGDSTAANDRRITPVGHAIRRLKLDEITQLWNVFVGDMSLVGPRPNTLREVGTYSEAERMLLSVRPGITDFSSIVFADEGQILSEYTDPDAAYQTLIRPLKSRLGIVYVQNRSTVLNMKLIVLTALSIVNRSAALRKTSALLASIGAASDLVTVARRERRLDSGTAR